MVAGMERETEGNWGSLFWNHQHPSSLPVPVSGGRIITPAQRPDLLELGLKSVWEREDIEDPVTKGSISCETFTVHHCDGQFEAFARDCRDRASLSQQQQPGGQPPWNEVLKSISSPGLHAISEKAGEIGHQGFGFS